MRINKNLLLIICFFLTLMVCGQTNLIAPAEYMKNYKTVIDRTQWWRDARFGLFIHFGPYAVPARGEWVRYTDSISNEAYQKYIDAFNPVDFDPAKWAKLARTAGMKYAVFTTKHHDGFCMFDTKLTDYKIGPQFGGRDLVREFLEAFRAEGIKVGLYYSITDWHHPDFPNIGNHPMRKNAAYGRQKRNWDNYLKYMHGQVEELMKNYGKIDVLWFDAGMKELKGEDWKAKDLIAMVRKYQPNIIMNNRLDEQGEALKQGKTLLTVDDFDTPEQLIPDSAMVDKYGNPIPWETCLTLNHSWGYSSDDDHWKSAELLIHSLVNCVSKNGNLILNIGPDAKGNIPTESVEILTEIGHWMQKNSESIYGCGASTLAKPEFGRFTQKGNNVYLHWMYPNLSPLKIKNFTQPIKTINLISAGTDVWYRTKNNNLLIDVDNYNHGIIKTLGEYDNVLRISVK